MSRAIHTASRAEIDSTNSVLTNEAKRTMHSRSPDVSRGLRRSNGVVVESWFGSLMCPEDPVGGIFRYTSIPRNHYKTVNMIFLQLSKLVLLSSALLLSLPDSLLAQGPCEMYGVVHEQAVSVNTDVLLNTTFNPFPEVVVTISNAPTSLDGITTFAWTETKTYARYPRSMTSSSSVQTTTTASDTSYVLLVRDQKPNHKRQSGSYYVSADGVITNDCTTTPVSIFAS